MRIPTDDQIPQLRDEKARGIAAKQILENSVFKDIRRRMHERLMDSWLKTAPDDVKGREWFHQQALAQAALFQALEKTITTGTMADQGLIAVEATKARSNPRRNRNAT